MFLHFSGSKEIPGYAKVSQLLFTACEKSVLLRIFNVFKYLRFSHFETFAQHRQ